MPMSFNIGGLTPEEAFYVKCDAETNQLNLSLDATAISLRPVQVTARKSDIAVGEVALVWAPWRKGTDGFPAPAWP